MKTQRQWQFGAVLGSVLFAACGGGNGVAVCGTDADCAVGQTCLDGVCVLGTDAGTDAGAGGGIGAPCTGTTSCLSGEVCIPSSDGFSGGYCSEPCGSHVCPAGAQCLDLTNTQVGEKACAESCQFASDCRSGYTCCPGYTNTCVPTAYCSAHADGGTGTHNDGGVGDGGTHNDGGTNDGGAGDGGTNDGGAGDGGTNDGGTNDGGTADDGGTNDGGTNDGGTADDGGTNDGGTADDGGTDGGTATDGGGVGDGGTNDGGTNDGGTTSDGGTDGGTTSDGGTDGGTGNDGGTLACSAPALLNGGSVGPASQPSCQIPDPFFPTLHSDETIQNLGRRQVGATVGFFVDAGVGTISIVQLAWDAGPPVTINGSDGGPESLNFITPISIKQPDGGTVFDAEDDIFGSIDPTAVEYFPGDLELSSQAMTFPNNTQGLTHQTGGYPVGNWSLTVGDLSYLCAQNDPGVLAALGDSSCSGRTGGVAGQTQYYDVRVITKPIAGDTGTLDIGLYMVSANWTAATAMADPNWARFLTTLEGVYANAGLCINSVTFYDVPDWAKTLYATGITDQDTPPCGNVQQMMTLSTSVNAMNFFFVDSLDTTNSEGFDSATGADVTSWLAGETPGPGAFGGTLFSGVALDATDVAAAGCTGSTDFVNCGADALAYVAAHKGGHMLGLYHTSESTTDANMNGVFDPLDDTPQCDPNNCDANADGEVQASECTDNSSAVGSCGGGDYLMFWMADTTAAGTISPEQGQIIRASPLVKAAAPVASRSNR